MIEVEARRQKNTEEERKRGLRDQKDLMHQEKALKAR